MQDASIEVSGLRVIRGGRLVLRDVSLVVAEGQVTGLLGPSGSGKTTLMRSVVGVQRIEKGNVRVLGAEAGSPELRARVGYMTQSPSIYGDLSVGENLLYFARVLGASRARIETVLETVGLSEFSGQVVRTLSGGEQARVSLASALLNEPRVLVLDEPTVGLDPVLRRDLWAFFHTLAEQGVTLLISSHVMDEANRCDNLLLMREGEILAAESPEGLRRRTGEPDLDAAFLKLIEGQASG